MIFYFCLNVHIKSCNTWACDNHPAFNFVWLLTRRLFHYTVRNIWVTTHLFLLSVLKRLHFKVSSQAFRSFLNDRIFCKLVTSQHNLIPSRTNVVVVVVLWVFLSSLVSRLWWRRKRKENTVIQKRKSKVSSCPISLNMFTRNALICTKKESDKTMSYTRAHI